MKCFPNDSVEPLLRITFLWRKSADLACRERTGGGGIVIRSTAGFSLIELMAVITIISIAIAISTLSFHSWQVKSKIEAQTRELFTDLSEARTNAFTQKKVYGIVFQPTSYVMKTYTSEVEYNSNASAAANGRVVASKSLKYGLTSQTGADISDSAVVFDTSGLATSWFLGRTIFVNPVTEPAALNCVVIYASRVNMGKINGTSCEFR
jgi:prepilin-type N-terminal cleavage/methylation domain-containing protein